MHMTSSSIPDFKMRLQGASVPPKSPLLEQFEPHGRLRGGCSSVYVSEHKETGKLVAIKMPRLDKSRLPEILKREIQVLQRISHPNVVSMLASDEQMPFIILEYLGEKSFRSPMERKAAVDAVCRASSALSDLHSMGILHRDIKPSHIFLANQIVKMVDFAFAKTEGVVEFNGKRPFGTLEFIAPEHFAGNGTDQRTDIYAMGMTLYYMLTRHFPVAEPTPKKFVRYLKGNQDPLPPSFWDDGISPELSTVVLRAIDKDPAKRFQSAGDMASALVKLQP